MIGLDELCCYTSGATIAPEEELSPASRQALEEAIACAGFYRHVNSQGLRLPPLETETHMALVRSLRNPDAMLKIMSLVGNWPPPDIWTTLGLAQHYGIPTRLLDWSSQAFTAAYFAAAGAFNDFYSGRTKPNQKLCVWLCISQPLLAGQYRANGGRVTTNQKSVEDAAPYFIYIIDVPTAGNPNLHAQSGRFTLVVKNEYYSNYDWNVSLDKAFELNLQYAEESGNDIAKSSLSLMRGDISNGMVKLTLPVEESPALLHWLRGLGYGAERMFPGYDGAVKGFEEEAALANYFAEHPEMAPG